MPIFSLVFFVTMARLYDVIECLMLHTCCYHLRTSPSTVTPINKRALDFCKKNSRKFIHQSSCPHQNSTNVDKFPLFTHKFSTIKNLYFVFIFEKISIKNTRCCVLKRLSTYPQLL